MDKLFHEIQRIFEWYIKIGTEAMAEQWLVAAIKRNFPTKISTDLFMELRKLNKVDEIRNIANLYRHDHRFGLPRGVPGAMLALTENTTESSEASDTNDNHAKANIAQPTANEHYNNGGGNEQCQDEFYAVPKGGKGKIGKGYGQCWECGEMGHPRRECPKFLARMNGKGGEVAALTGGGKKGKVGKGKGGKGGKGKWNGKGNQHYRTNCNYNDQSPGKAVGKGLNNFDMEYFDARGDELNGYGGGDASNWWHEDWSNGTGMNLMMMLERAKPERNDPEEKTAEVTGERDPLRCTKKIEPIALSNTFNALQNNDDTDSEDENEEPVMEHVSEHEVNSNLGAQYCRHRPNKRQRQRRREQQHLNLQHAGCCHPHGNQVHGHTMNTTQLQQRDDNFELEEAIKNASEIDSLQSPQSTLDRMKCNGQAATIRCWPEPSRTRQCFNSKCSGCHNSHDNQPHSTTTRTVHASDIDSQTTRSGMQLTTTSSSLNDGRAPTPATLPSGGSPPLGLSSKCPDSHPGSGGQLHFPAVNAGGGGIRV